jgi:hypothetical protein
MLTVESAIEKLKIVREPIGYVVKKKIHAVMEKNLDYIDFKTTNDIMRGRHSSKNYYLLIFCPSNMLKLHRLM